MSVENVFAPLLPKHVFTSPLCIQKKKKEERKRKLIDYTFR